MRKTFDINVFSQIFSIQTALDYLPAGASIITTSSIQGFEPTTNLLQYAATKAALANLTKGLAAQFAERGIRVNAVAPGPIWTPLQVACGT
ncbi:SDR family oxidoreductase [Faucicola atlantae]|uniref:SDR family oxidoreductase n=1 Tax=Faucicola atlantae TaxID=34059 RepID=UPI0025B0C08D|nr:SDR family oxidoreductase [Moraxella atlantae]